MSEHDERVEALAKVIDAATAYTQPGRGLVTLSTARAEAVVASDWLRDLLAAERAKALREAAEQHRDQFGPLGAASRSWLLREADRTHPVDPEETR